MLTVSDKKKIQVWIDKFPHKRGALTMALRIVQDRIGWLPKEALDAVADHLELEKVDVYEVASFYSLFRLEPSGSQQVKVCTSLSCCLSGSEEVLTYLEKKLGVSSGGVNAKGIALGEIECLGACTKAPVILWNDQTYIEDVTPEKIDDFLVKVMEALGE